MTKKSKVYGMTFPPPEVRFMAIAVQVSWLSKNPNEQVGAVIVDSKLNILTVGWNEKINSIYEKDLSYSLEETNIWMNSAASNAVQMLNKYPVEKFSLKLFTTHMPCLFSTKQLLHSGVKEIIYGKKMSSWYSEKEFEEIKKLIKLTNATLEKFNGNLSWARDRWSLFAEENI